MCIVCAHSRVPAYSGRQSINGGVLRRERRRWYPFAVRDRRTYVHIDFNSPHETKQKRPFSVHLPMYVRAGPIKPMQTDRATSVR